MLVSFTENPIAIKKLSLNTNAILTYTYFQNIQKKHNVYAHGPLSATCEFGRFSPYPNCFDKREFYVNTLNPFMDQKECEKLERDLAALGFKEGTTFFRTR